MAAETAAAVTTAAAQATPASAAASATAGVYQELQEERFRWYAWQLQHQWRHIPVVYHCICDHEAVFGTDNASQRCGTL